MSKKLNKNDKTEGAWRLLFIFIFLKLIITGICLSTSELSLMVIITTKSCCSLIRLKWTQTSSPHKIDGNK